MIKLVVFDFDDTLCLTEQGCFYLENDVLRRMGIPPMSRKVHIRTWGRLMREALLERAPGVDVDKFIQIHSLLFPTYVKEGRLDAITLENLSVLDKLRKHNKNLAILTSRHLAEVEHLLMEEHPLKDRVDAFYHSDNNDYFKPDPRVFDKVISDFKMKPEDIVYVGDSVSDAIASNEAGLKFIAVLESGLRTENDFKNTKVDYFAKKFTEILPFIISN